MKTFKCSLIFILKHYSAIWVNYITLHYKAFTISIMQKVFVFSALLSSSEKWHLHSTSWGRVPQISHGFCSELGSYKRSLCFTGRWIVQGNLLLWRYSTTYPCTVETESFPKFSMTEQIIPSCLGRKTHYPVHHALYFVFRLSFHITLNFFNVSLMIKYL